MQGARQASARMEFEAQSSRQGPGGPAAGEGSDAEALPAMRHTTRACVKVGAGVYGREGAWKPEETRVCPSVWSFFVEPPLCDSLRTYEG